MKMTIREPKFYKDFPDDEVCTIVEYEVVTEYNGDIENIINWMFANKLLDYGKPEDYKIKEEEDGGFSIFGPWTLDKNDPEYELVSEYYFVARDEEEE